MAYVDLYLKLLHEENVLKKRLSDNKEQQDKISKEVWKSFQLQNIVSKVIKAIIIYGL